MKSFKYSLFLLFLLNYSELFSITLVYNMRVRRAFDVRALLGEQESFWNATAVPIIYSRDRHIVDPALSIDVCEDSLIGGSLFNIQYVSSNDWWAEVTTGLEKESMCLAGTSTEHASRVGLDDIIFAAGYNMFPSEHGQITLYGITGFPAKRDVTLAERFNTLVGTRFFSLGAGLELSYGFIDEPARGLTGILQLRFIHFFDRNWFPILPPDARIQPGNTTDVLLAGEYRRNATSFEVGYNPTIFTNQAVCLATGKVDGPKYVRNAFYGNVSHVFKNFMNTDHPLVVGAGLSVAHIKRFDTNIVAAWISLTTIF